MRGRSMPFSLKGQSLTEVSLIAAAVLVVTIPALTLLKDSVSSGFSNMLQEAPPPVVAVGGGSSNAAGAGATGAGGSSQASGQYVSPDVITVKGPKGTTIELSVPVDAAASVQAVGVNGTVEMLASSIEAMAKHLLAEGKIDESGSNALINLANLAHRQAAISAVVDNAMAQGGSDTKGVLASNVQFEGKSYKLSDLAGLIATGSATSSGNYNYGPEIAKLWSAYGGLWDTGAMKDPTSAAIVDAYVHEIANLTDSNRVVLSKMETGYGGTPDSYRQSQAEYLKSIGFSNTAALLKEKTGSQVTHQDATGICDTGGNQDSGTKCSG